MEFGKITGVPVILNTSFNVAGDPIVETPGDALECFLSTQIDYLVMGQYIVAKKDRKSAHAIADLTHRLHLAERKTQRFEAELEAIGQSRGWKLLNSFNRFRRFFTGKRKDVDFM